MIRPKLAVRRAASRKGARSRKRMLEAREKAAKNVSRGNEEQPEERPS